MRAADSLLEIRRRVGRQGIDGHRRAQLARQCQLGIVHVDRRHLQAHRARVLHGHVTEPTDAGDHDPLAGLRVGDLEPLVDRDARAQHRRRRDEVQSVRQMADIGRVGQGVLGEAAVDRVAGVALALAQRLPAAEAVRAGTAGRVQPRNADPIALTHVRDAGADRDHVPDALVPRNERRRRLDRPVAFDGMQIGVTDAARGDLDQDVAGAGTRNRHLLDREGLAECAHDGGFHGVGHGWLRGVGKVVAARSDEMCHACGKHREPGWDFRPARALMQVKDEAC